MLTDSTGRFQFIGLPNGRYVVSIAAIGFRPEVRTVLLGDRNVVLDIQLTATLVELAEIQVTASAQATTTLSSPQPVSVVGMDALAEVPTLNLAATLQELPGLRNVSTGAGIGKPMIRGLTSSRVLVLADGQRVESQSWGDEHAANVEAAEAERVEVIRGPASVLYGSEALGGVVNVVSRPLPDAIGRPAFLRGSASASYATNGRQPEGSLRLEGARRGFGARASLTGRTLDATRTPDGPLFNSGASTVGGSVAAGLRGDWGSAHLTYARRGERLEIHENPAESPGATPFQRVTDDRIQLESNLPVGASHLDLSAGLQRNDRREFEAAADTEAILRLRSTTASVDARLHHAPVRSVGGIIGLSALRSELTTGGAVALVPANTASQAGVYAFEQAELGRVSLSGGVRFDWRRLDVERDTALGVVPQRRVYQSVTGNAGAVLRVTPSTAVVVNLGRGYRAPSAFDLFANGVHEGAARFERGDSTLRTETSLNADLALRLQTATLSAEIGVFSNWVDGFIYPDPTGLTDSASGFPIYDITQGDARLAGFEASAEWHPVAALHLRGGLDYVRGDNQTTNQPLAFIPPLRATYNARLELVDIGVLRSPWFSVGGETNAKQTRLDPQDYAPTGFTLVHLGAGTQLELGGRTLALTIQLRNALDARYTSFMSRYKFYALDAGRSLIVSARTEF